MSERELHPICETLRDARLDANRTQTDVATGARIWQSSISDYETGRSVPTLLTLDQWAAQLGYAVILVPTVDQ